VAFIEPEQHEDVGKGGGGSAAGRRPLPEGKEEEARSSRW
jgi:hypothetical protein